MPRFGLYLYYEEADYEGALRELAFASRRCRMMGTLAFTCRCAATRGPLAEAIAAYQRAEAIDPRNQVTLTMRRKLFPGCVIGATPLRGT